MNGPDVCGNALSLPEGSVHPASASKGEPQTSPPNARGDPKIRSSNGVALGHLN